MNRHFLAALITLATSMYAQSQNTFPSTGNVGIGTTSPQKLLHVKGFGAFGRNVTSANSIRALNLADADAVMRILRVHATNAPAIELLSRTTPDGANVAYWDLYAQPSDKSFRIRDRVSGANLDRFTITGSGNVGIGTVSPTRAKLEVNGVAGSGNTSALFGGGGSGISLQRNWPTIGFNQYRDNTVGNGKYMADGSAAIQYMDPTTGKMHFDFFQPGTANTLTDAGNHVLTLTKEGNVGIGTITPSTPLHVEGSKNYVIRAINTHKTEGNIAILGSSNHSPGIGAGIVGHGGKSGVHGSGRVYGVRGEVSGDNHPYTMTRAGVYGEAYGGTNAYGILGYAANASSTNYAGYFSGSVYTTGSYLPSARKLKEGIEPLSGALSHLLKLKPTTYRYKRGEYQQMYLPEGRQMGLIAEEVKQVFPELVQAVVQPAKYDEEDRTKLISPEVHFEGVNYQGLIPVLIASVQEQQQQIKERDNRIEALERDNADIKRQLAELKALLTSNNSNSTSVNISSAYLEQAAPNPARGSTTIRYHVPQDAGAMRLTLTNAKGQVLKTLNLTGRGGVGQLNLDTATLSSGVYNYTLWVNGQQTASRQLVVTR